MILPALLLTLDKYSSWRLGRVVPMIRSAIRSATVELFQQHLCQVELPQLAKEVQPLLGLFHNGLNVIVPLQVLRNCGAQEPE